MAVAGIPQAIIFKPPFCYWSMNRRLEHPYCEVLRFKGLIGVAALTAVVLSQAVAAAPTDTPADRAASVVAQLRDASSVNHATGCAARIDEGDIESGGLKGRFLIATDPAMQTGIIKTTNLGLLDFSIGVTKTGVWVRDGNATIRDADFPGFRAGLVSEIYWASGGLANACWPAEVRYVGEESQGADVADILEVVPQGGKVTKVWVSRESHLPLKWTRRDEPAVATTSYAVYGSDTSHGIPLEQTFVDRDGTRWVLHTKRVRRSVPPSDVAALSTKPQTRLTDYGIDSATTTTVPMRIEGQLYVDVFLDGKGPFNFMVDTGATLQLSSNTIAQLGLKALGEGSDTDIDGNAFVERIVKLPEFRLGDARISGLYGKEADLGGGASGGPRPLDGVIGTELLDRFVTTFDYPHHSLTLALHPNLGAADDARFSIPFMLDHTFPVTAGRINGVPAQFWIDTGSNTALVVNVPFALLHAGQMPSRKYDGASIAGSSGKGSPVLMGRLESIEVGQLTVPKPVALFPTLNVGLVSDTETAGDLGDAVFMTSALTFDYQDRKAWVVPDATVAPSVAKNIETGMRVEVDSTGDAVVGAIYKDSPAWEAGLRKGDQITAIDGNPVSQDLVNATRRKISSGELKSVRLSVLRDKASFDVVVRPRDYIQ